MSFQISCESAVDMPYSVWEKRGIPVLFYTYSVNGTESEDDMGRTEGAAARFYDMLRSGVLPSTSQINQFRYEAFFEPLLQKGDLMHIVLGSGMTSSINGARAAAQTLSQKYPDRRISVIDSVCSSSGYGMLVDAAANMRDRGADMDETEAWICAHSVRIHHQFFSTDLQFLRRSGRISGPSAMAASVLGICPLLRLNREGRIVAYSKVRGHVHAVRETVHEMLLHAEGGADYDLPVFICHSDCADNALNLKREIEKQFPKATDIRIFEIGPIIGSHCGPGIAAIFFFGDERPE